MNEFKGISKVFSFTFNRQISSKGYKNTTAIVGIILFLLPAVILSCIAAFGMDGETATPEAMSTYNAENIYFYDATDPKFDPNLLGGGFNYFVFESEEAAFEAASTDEHGLVLVIEKPEHGYDVSVVLPENSVLTETDRDIFGDFIFYNFNTVLAAKSGLTAEQLEAVFSAPEIIISLPENKTESPDEYIEDTEQQDESFNEVIVYIVCYLNIMLLYFMVLFYGQGVANSVILEKTSKLMDFFLVTVKPGAMVLGKVFAIALSGALQIGVWVCSAVLGLIAGAFIGGEISPVFAAVVSEIWSAFDMLSGMFSLPSIIVALLISASGLLLYSSLASIGGSLASKPEDLASTNQIFSLVLVASFFAVIFTGGESIITDMEIFNWIPFTAVLITPGRVLTGEVTLLGGIASLGLILLFSVLITYVAGRIYKMMSLYKGDPPKINKVIEMLKNNK